VRVYNLDAAGTPLPRGWFILLGFLIALTVGTAIASSNIPLAIIILLGGGLTAYLLIFRHFIWQLAVLLCFLDFYLEPLGFRFGALELSCLLGFALFVVQIWQRRVDIVHPFFRTNAFRFFRAALFLWLFYAIARFVWNYIQPFNPAEYALSNAVKSEFLVTAIILLMWLFSFRPRDVTVNRGFTTITAFLLSIGLYVNIAIRLYGISQGIFENPGTSDIESALFIPFLNLSESPYSLRFVSPIAVFYGLTFLTSPRIRRPIAWRIRLLYYGLILGGFFGAAVSGARASSLFALGFCILILIVRRKFVAIALLGTLAFIGFALLNVFSQKIASDPGLAPVQRSLYWAMMDQAQWAGTSIDSSNRWRQELFYRAIDEWKSDWIIFWFGRGTYKYTDEDWDAIEMNGFEGSMDTSLRRGATHNLVSDLLLVYGVVGLVLYFVVCVALIRLCFRVATDRELPEDVTDLGVISAVAAVITVFYGVIAGDFIKHYEGWFVVMILARIAQSAVESTKGVVKAPPAFNIVKG
jgi:O-antigen ligase/polysaccharide polymerase Wzy-like membrane protein